MDAIFLKILEMSLSGAVCVLFVLALRMFLRRKPRAFSYVLWTVVFLRLLCPVTLQSRYFGLALGNMEQTLETAAYEQELVQYQTLVRKDGTAWSLTSRGRLGMLPQAVETEDSGLSDMDGIPGAAALEQGMGGVSFGFGDQQTQGEQISRRYSRSEVQFQVRKWVAACSWIWAAGAVILLGYSLVSYLLLRRRLRCAVRIQEDVYESDQISTPFLLGFFDPRIYLPVGLPQEERAYVLAHELVHLKRGDYLVKAAAWLTLSLHWFNPLVWLAYSLMARDMEMSCDERVIRRLGEGSKKAYSNALLTISSVSGETGKKTLAAVPLSFGENDIRSRVKNVLAYRGVKIGTGAALALLLAAAGLILMTDRREPEDSGPEQTPGTEVWVKEQTGTDAGDGEGVSVYYQQAEILDETPLGSLESLREMSRGDEMTWERLQTLAEQRNPSLEDYAGYEGANWPDGERDDISLTACLFYTLEDTDNGQSYRLDIYYWKEDLSLESILLMRESDGEALLLYRDGVAEGQGLYRNTDIAAFRRDIKHLSDWVSDWKMPHEQEVSVGAYQAGIYMDGGVLFDWTGSGRNDPEGGWAPEEWRRAGGFIRVYREEDAPFIFDDSGRLTDFFFLMNHTEITSDCEPVEGCQEQAILVSMNHDLYTASELDELAQAGTPIPEEESTVDIWYVGFAREDAPYGYVLFLAERYFTKEEVIAMAQSIRFTEEAWEEDGVFP